jgi:hypothetical protein
VQGADLAQQAVDAIADAQEAGFGFEVEVGGAALDGIGKQGVDEPYHRLGVGVAPAGQTAGVRLAVSIS